MEYPESPHQYIHYAYVQLTDKPLTHQAKLLYSGRLKDYHANVSLSQGVLTLKLNKKWRAIDAAIQIGVIQDLLARLFKLRKKTTEIELYHHFTRSLHLSIPKTKSHPKLSESFTRVNERYFLSTIEQPNLVWAGWNKRKLASYDFKTDTIAVSKVFFDMPHHLLDYVMYHEMLHKRHQYKNSGLRNHYHSKTFKQAEKIFENHEAVEAELNKKLRYARIRRFLPWV